MDNIVSLKRAAQKLVQQGDYEQAIEQYTKIVESKDMDPYDYVVLGDLLLRNGHIESAINRYEEALDAYMDGGLHRNAIALAKRIHRLMPTQFSVQKCLGDLYSREGLNTEAALHYLEYLEQAKEEENFADIAEETCGKLLGLVLPTFDLVPRIVDIAKDQDRCDGLAPGVLAQSQRAAQMGRKADASKLQALALELDPDVMSQPSGMLDPGAVTIDEPPAAPNPATAAPAEIHPEDPGVVNLEMGVESATPSGDIVLDDPSAVNLGGDDSGSSGGGSDVIDLDAAMSVGGHTETGDESADPEELLARAHKSLERGGPVLAQRDFMRAGQGFVDAGDPDRAEEVFMEVVSLDPNHLEALQALVSIAKSQGSRDKQVKYGCELGDVLLARDKYAEAKQVFEHVIEADPENQKASARLQRLETLVNGASASPSPAPEKSGEVTVKDEQTTPTQTDLDLAAILDEFRSSIVETIPSEDAQSHYDMGMAYVEMELLQEAVAEFETAAENEDIRPRALEMLAVCYRRLERGDDALVALEEVLALTIDDEGQARIHLAIGHTRESMGLDFEAEEAYFQALELNQDLVEAAERLSELEKKRA